MKKYKCIFDRGSRGNTTINVFAEDAERAIAQAKEGISDCGTRVEIWDETGLVVSRESPKTDLQ